MEELKEILLYSLTENFRCSHVCKQRISKRHINAGLDLLTEELPEFSLGFDQ